MYVLYSAIIGEWRPIASSRFLAEERNYRSVSNNTKYLLRFAPCEISLQESHSHCRRKSGKILNTEGFLSALRLGLLLLQVIQSARPILCTIGENLRCEGDID